jgi:hypothetical protein
MKIFLPIKGRKMKIMRFAIPGLLILLLASAGCNKDEEFDIRGTWSFTTGTEVHFVFTFSGWLESGTLALADPQDGAGTYTVSGETVVFNFTSTLEGGKNCHFSGSFTSEDKLTGTMDFVAPYPPFEWTREVEGQRQ